METVEEVGMELKSIVRHGVWAITDGRIRRVCLIIGDGVEKGDGQMRDIFWVDELAMVVAVLAEEGWWKPRQLKLETIEQSQDITQEYLADRGKLNFLLMHVPGWVDIILSAREEIVLPEAIVMEWMKSPKKSLRVMGIKFLGRMDRSRWTQKEAETE